MGEILIKTKTGFYLWRNPLDKSQEILGATVPMINHNGVDLREHKLSLKNCQAIERGYDLEELANELECYTAPHCYDFKTKEKIGFKLGFQKALKILGDKKFSEDDLREAYEIGRNYQRTGDVDLHVENYIQSLQQTEWEVEIEMDVYECTDKCKHLDEWDLCHNDGCKLSQLKPKLDSNGCLILKLKQ